MSCLTNALLRVCCFVQLIAGFALLLAALHHLPPIGSVKADPDAAWAPLLLLCVGATLLFVGLVASFGAWCRQCTGPLHLESADRSRPPARRVRPPAARLTTDHRRHLPFPAAGGCHTVAASA